MEREARFELATSTWKGCALTLSYSRLGMVGADGFEPLTSTVFIGSALTDGVMRLLLQASTLGFDCHG